MDGCGQTLLQRIQDANQRIADAQAELAELRNQCTHPKEAAREERRRINDEWDSHAHYATFGNCGICGASWYREDKR